MSVTAASGPFIVFGNPPNTGSEYPNQYNPDNGPGFEFAMSGQLDTSVGYQPGQAPSRPIYGWTGGTLFTMDYAPQTLATTNIAAAAAPAGVPFTLVSSSAAGIIVGQSLISRGNAQLITGLLAIDGPSTLVKYGSNQAISVYDLRSCFGRVVSYTSAGNASNVSITTRGYDYLGFPMQETVTGPNATTVNGKKAFKYIFSVTPSGTPGATVSIGTADIFGFPIRSDTYEQLDMAWAGSWITTSGTGTFTFADLTNPSTAASGDVRGTWTASSASNGAKVWALYQTIPPWNMPGSPGVIVGTTTTNGTTAIGNSTLNFASIPAYVTVGTTVYDSTTTLAIPPGTTVTAIGATTLTMSSPANIQVGNGDTIQFGQANVSAGVIGLPQFFTAQTVAGVTFG